MQTKGENKNHEDQEKSHSNRKSERTSDPQGKSTRQTGSVRLLGFLLVSLSFPNLDPSLLNL